MASRGAIIAALLVLELVISGEAVVAVRGDRPAAFAAPRMTIRIAGATPLIEGGPHQRFDAGAHSALSVDIGYADLTIVTSTAPQIDVSASASTSYGVFRETAPLVARADGDTIRIAVTGDGPMAVGDDRMVTVVLPARTPVTVLHAGNIRATGLRAEASFQSVGRGVATIEDYAGSALHVTSNNGRITLHQIVATRLDVTSSNDRVDGTALQVHTGDIETSDGATLGFVTAADTIVNAATDNGRIHVTGFSAPAATERTSSQETDGHASSQTFRIGAGSGNIYVHAGDGNITIGQDG